MKIWMSKTFNYNTCWSLDSLRHALKRADAGWLFLRFQRLFSTSSQLFLLCFLTYRKEVKP